MGHQGACVITRELTPKILWSLSICLLYPTARPQAQKPNLAVSVLHCGIAHVGGDTLKYFLDGEKIRREERKGRRDGEKKANSKKPPLQEVAHTEGNWLPLKAKGKRGGFRLLLSGNLGNKADMFGPR